MIRSLLIAKAADPLALDRALATPADALLLDLRGGGADARTRAGGSLREAKPGKGPALIALINPLDEGGADDLVALCPHRPAGVALPRAESGADLQRLAAALAVEEAKAGLETGALRIVAIAETGGALFDLISFGPATERLDAIAWDGEALSVDLGAEMAREGGDWIDPCHTSRTLTLAACAHSRLAAIDAPFSSPDLDAFRREAEAARRDGFAGKLTIDAAQVRVVNEVFARR